MKEKPLAELTLRKYERPFRLSGRDLVKKLCLSVGLLQPADSRDVVVDVFYSLLRSESMTASELEEAVKKCRKQHNLPLTGVASSNIRRQVKRLKDALFIERVDNSYRVAENAPLHEVFTERIEKFYLPAIVSRVKEYCEAVEKERWKHGSNMPKVQEPDE
jgi:DNA-binding transcriptional ArsR family regulator